jgi:hypothetical protein
MTLTADQWRALQLLKDAGPGGCTESIMLAHGFKIELLAGLVREGLASAAPETVRAGGRSIEVVRMRITAEGRRGT